MQDDKHDNKPLQPSYDAPFGVALTPTEISALAVDNGSGQTGFTTFVGDNAEILLECGNERTGHACRLARMEWESGYEYMVEMETGEGFVVASWSCEFDNYPLNERVRRDAEQTMILWSAVIGVPVSYGLRVNRPR